MFSPSRLPRRVAQAQSPTARSGTQLIVEDRRERLLYIEDDRLLRLAFVRFFGAYRVDVAPTLAEALRRTALDTDYLAWIVDENLPDGSGLSFVEEARARGLRVPVLLVTAEESRSIVNRAQLAGVEIAFKPDMSSNVLAFLERSRAARSATPAVLRATDRFADLHGLSPRERDLVRAIGRGVPRASLGLELDLSENTVKTLTRRVLRKTAMASLDDALRAILSADGTERSDDC